MFANPKTEVAVVVPVYKTEMAHYEQISFRQCLSVLGHHRIVIAAPEGLSVDCYHRAAGQELEVRRFENRFFRDISGYNRLMLSASFYQRFADFRYILIHQLDAFVFSDQLLAWCGKGYDYVGAPWINVEPAAEAAVSSSRLRRSFPAVRRRMNQAVGNGGLSLRNVGVFLRTLHLLRSTAERWQGQEDYFWAFCATSYNPFLKLPKLETALQFAFETRPSECYARNERRLPFGCHAWEKYEPEFWKPFLQDCGYVL